MTVVDAHTHVFAAVSERFPRDVHEDYFPAEAEAGLSVRRGLRIVDAPTARRSGMRAGNAYDAERGRRLITE